MVSISVRFSYSGIHTHFWSMTLPLTYSYLHTAVITAVAAGLDCHALYTLLPACNKCAKCYTQSKLHSPVQTH